MLVPERLLHGVEIAVGGEAFDGDQFAAVGLHGEHGAGFDGLAVDGDGAGAADGGFAADVGSGEAGDLAEVMDEKQARFDFVGIRLAVNFERNFSFHPVQPSRCEDCPAVCYLVVNCREMQVGGDRRGTRAGSDAGGQAMGDALVPSRGPARRQVKKKLYKRTQFRRQPV